jgi:ribonuclease HI
VFSRNGEIVGEHSERTDHSTNNRAELAAVGLALRLAPDGEHVTIATDSANVIGWLSLRWKRKVPEIAVACAAIDKLLARAGGVSFVHVRGHRGNAMNERADKLAVMAVKGDLVGGS